jgi:hypothetical protein
LATPTPTSPDTSGYPGADDAFSGNSDYTAQAFLVAQIVARIAGATLVQVKAVTNAGGLAPVGFVDVQPMVNMMDGLGNATPHGIIHHLPYFRLQGGGDAVILDPKVGDIGIAIFADRDIASVKATKQTANPGSRRQNDMADGLYIGGYLNGVPTAYVQFSASGITVTSPIAVIVNAPTITLNGNVVSTGTFTNNGHDTGSTHRHTGVQGGSGTSGPPV